jgi:uncharacterized protein (DUF2267 family)
MIRRVKTTPKPAALDPAKVAEAEERAEQRLEQRRLALTELELKRQALNAYLAGKSTSKIAEELGLEDAKKARKLIETAIIEERSDMRDKMKDTTELRLSALLEGSWENAKKGDPKAGRMVLEIIERQCKLYGLDSPVEVKLQEGVLQVLAIVKRVVSSSDYAKIALELSQLDRAVGTSFGGAGREALPPVGEFH